MDKIVKYIEATLPMTACNLRCPYCYVSQMGEPVREIPPIPISVSDFRRALSKKRLGGAALIEFCAQGETLMQPHIAYYFHALLEEGHYVGVVTNATYTKAFEEICSFPRELLAHMFFKCSFHYSELKRKGLLDTYFSNIRMARDAGASFTVELSSSDEIIPLVDEIKEVCVKNIGALPQVTILRDDAGKRPLLTKLPLDEYKKVWESFDSPMFNYKYPIWGRKVKEFCYGGKWTFMLMVTTGELRQCCPTTLFSQNIYEDLDAPIKEVPIGNYCIEAHCFNSHAWLTLGTVPELQAPTYAEMRNRKCADGTEWLQPEMKSFLSQKLYDNNKELTSVEKTIANWHLIALVYANKVKRKIKRMISK